MQSFGEFGFGEKRRVWNLTRRRFLGIDTVKQLAAAAQVPPLETDTEVGVTEQPENFPKGKNRAVVAAITNAFRFLYRSTLGAVPKSSPAEKRRLFPLPQDGLPGEVLGEGLSAREIAMMPVTLVGDLGRGVTEAAVATGRHMLLPYEGPGMIEMAEGVGKAVAAGVSIAGDGLRGTLEAAGGLGGAALGLVGEVIGAIFAGSRDGAVAIATRIAEGRNKENQGGLTQIPLAVAKIVGEVIERLLVDPLVHVSENIASLAPVDLVAREHLKTTAGIAVLATLTLAGFSGEARADGRQKRPDDVDYANKAPEELIEIVLENMKTGSTIDQIKEFVSKYLIFDLSITGCFMDFIYHGVKTQPARLARVYHGVEFRVSNREKARLADEFRKDEGGRLAGLLNEVQESPVDTKLFFANELARLKAMEGRGEHEEMKLAYLEREALMGEIPGVAGVSLAAVGSGLALKYLLGNEQAREEVGHTLKETGLGVVMLTSFAVLMEKAVINDPTLPLIAEKYKKSKKIEREPAGNLDNTFEHLFDSVSNSYLLCALSLTSTAFGDAALMGKRLTAMCDIFVPDITAVFKGKSLEDARSIASAVKNSYLRETLTKLLADCKSDTIDENAIESIKARLIKDFSFELIGTMDRAQIGLGDIGPLVGACQSFGVKEALKTGFIEWLINAVFIQSTLSSALLNKRFGFDMKPRGFGTAMQYAKATVKNLIPGFGLTSEDREDIRKHELGESPNRDLIDKGSQIITGSGLIEPVAQAAGILGHLFTSISHALKHGERMPPHDHQRLSLVLAQVVELQKSLSQNQESEVSDDDKPVLDFLERAVNVAEIDRTDQETLDEVKHAYIDLEEKIKLKFREKELKIADSNDPCGELMKFLEDFKNPKFKEAFGFHAYEHKFGATIADTMFNVLIQGLCLTSITKIIGVFYNTSIFKALPYEVKLLVNCMIHAVLSAVADNWGDQIVNANHMFQYFAVPEMMKKHDLDIKGINLEELAHDGPAVLGRYEMFLTKVTKNIQDEDEKKKIYMDLLYEFILGKHISMAVSAAGGELTLIGNSPHFMAFIGELKKYITMETSIENIYERWPILATKVGSVILGAIAGAKAEFAFIKKFKFPWANDVAIEDMSFAELIKHGPLKCHAA